MMEAESSQLKRVVWIGSSRKDLKAFPRDVHPDIGYALYAAQRGEEYASVKALKGFGGRSFSERHLRSSRVPEEIEERHRDAET